MPLSEESARRILVALFALNAVAATAAAIVLALWPGAIPSTVGIAITPSQNFLSYLLAAAELAIAALAVAAIRSESIEVKKTAAGVLIVFHAGSAAAGIAAITQGAGMVVVVNLLVRVLMVAALGVCWMSRLSPSHLSRSA